MSQYLTEEEIPIYCTAQAGVSINDVIIASDLIDSYLGKSFSEQEAVDTVKLNDKNRGRLLNSPVIEVLEVKELVQSPVGISKVDVANTSVYLDDEMDGYFTFFAPQSPFVVPMFMPCGFKNGRKIVVKYKYGFTAVPEQIKTVTAMLAQNIRQMQTFMGFKKLNTLDYTIEMGNPSFFTDDMRTILNKFR